MGSRSLPAGFRNEITEDQVDICERLAHTIYLESVAFSDTSYLPSPISFQHSYP